MKILYHHRTASRDGQAVHIEEMVAAFRSLGHEVRVVSPTAGGNGKMGGEVGWVLRLKELLPRAVYELLELAYSVVAYRRLEREARAFEPDFIYERYNLFLLAGVFLKRRRGIPLLLEVNSPLVHERSLHGGGLSLRALARWAEGTAWRSADHVLPVTRVLGRYVAEYGVPEERIAVIPNGVNEAHFSGAPDAPAAKAALGLAGRLVLGFTGFVRDWHGVDRVVRWLATAQAPENAFLLIVGDGPARGKLETQAEILGVADKIRFTGALDRLDVPARVAAFDVALQPAVTAYASPLKLMEYLYLGKAIVAPAEPNLLEILTDRENALMFDARRARGLEDALSILCGDAALRRALGAGARRTIDTRELTWRGNAKKVIALAAGRKA
ncbi:MAG: glycosyltransferase family 4 protein [Candidatus Accumulibacter sp.]|nr:glycosyltransferase family 4 protein [Accumulibacter sp.]